VRISLGSWEYCGDIVVDMVDGDIIGIENWDWFG
jgi:hypothetical protein